MGLRDFLSNKKITERKGDVTLPFGTFTFSEALTISFYALAKTDNIPASDVTEKLTEAYKYYELTNLHQKLSNKNILQRKGYSFHYDDITYKLAPELVIPTIKWLYDYKEGHEVLYILRNIFKEYALSSTPIQIAILDYVSSNYQDATSAQGVFTNDISYLLSSITDEDFLLFYSNLSEMAFTELVKKAIGQYFYEGKVVDTSKLLLLAKNRDYKVDVQRDVAVNYIQLYEYLAKGVLPTENFMVYEYGHILKAVICLYNSKYEEAMKLFHKAMTQHNAKCSDANMRGIFKDSIINFLWVVCAHHLKENDTSLTVRNMLKRNTSLEAVKAAWCISAILTGQRSYANELRLIFTSSQVLSRQLITLAVRFCGRNDILTDEAFDIYKPTWMVLKYETDKYEAMREDEKKAADKVYQQPQLSSIYMKQHWEFVIEKLIQKSESKGKDTERTERIAYFLHDMNSDNCEIRLQSILKNGSWSAGKGISMSSFLTMQERFLTDSDITIRNRCRLNYGSYYASLTDVIDQMKYDERLYVGRSAPYTLVRVEEEMPYLMIDRSERGFEVKSNIALEDVDKDIIITSRTASELHYLKMNNEVRPYFSQLLELGYFPVNAEPILKNFLESLRGKVEIHTELIKGGTTLDTVKGTSNITIQMRPQGKEAYMVSIFCRALAEGYKQCAPGEGSSVIIDIQGDHRVCVERDLEREKELYTKLREGVGEGLPPEKAFQMDAYDLLPLLDFIRENNEEYIVEWPEGQKLNIHNRYTASQWSATLKKNKNGWFEMEGTVQLDENTEITISQLMDLIGKNKGRFIRLSEGEYVALSERLRRQLSTLDAIASRSRNKLQMSPFSAALLDSSIVDGELHLDVDPELKEIRQRILDSSEYKPEVPKKLNATLRPYQLEGFQWIARLNSWGAGALLADDMGLGKTIQTITYLLFKAKEGPALVVAPASVAPNWKTEFEKFAPSLTVSVLNFASNRSTCIANAKAGDVVITTYGLLLSVKEEITKKQWTTICLDEAHVIKNRGAKTSGVAMQLKSQYRIMLTGTPVQNHLGELWNLFQFVNPGLLGSYEDFGRRFITPIEVGKDKQRQKELDCIVHPFMLRRTKEKVLNELPEKTEIYQTVELSQEELAVYEVIRKKAEDMLVAETSEKVSVNTLAEITRLRQAACSAQLIEKTWKGKSSKVEALVEALEPIVESGDAALVFSQFTSFLAIIQKALQKAKIPYLYIDGTITVKERQTLVEKFQNGLCPVFLISLKAGGLGLNLTRANYVFHLDPWWNPAIEQQATDRAYRMGQHNAVTVYHLLSANTIEEKIRRLHESKRDLAENILEGTDMSSKLTGKDLLEMVR